MLQNHYSRILRNVTVQTTLNGCFGKTKLLFTPCRAVPGNTLRDAHKPQKCGLALLLPGLTQGGPLSVTFAALHSQKTPRIGWCVNSNKTKPPFLSKSKLTLLLKFYTIDE